MAGFDPSTNGRFSADHRGCVERFIEAELDFHSPGGRGIGRLSEVIPRYGAYFRKYLQSMDQAELTKLRSLVRTQIRLRERADGARSAQRQVPADSAVRDDARLQPQVPQANAVETAASDGNVENQNKEEDYSLNDFP